MDTKEIYDVVYGHKVGPSLREWGYEIFFRLCFERSKHSPLAPAVINRRLKSLGYTDSEIHSIRDIFVGCTKTAITRLQYQHPSEIPNKYVATGPDWFGVYQFFLNIDPRYHEEKNDLVHALFKLKLQKMNQ